MKKNFSKEFAKFQKNKKIQTQEMEKLSGGTCIFYCSSSLSDCDRDDHSTSYQNGVPVDIDKSRDNPSTE
jgi:hypothetical protein